VSGGIDMADAARCFLDEIANVPLNLQAKLCRVFGNWRSGAGRSSTLGGSMVRVLAGDQRRCECEAAAGRFRQDLLFRLIPSRSPSRRCTTAVGTSTLLQNHHFLQGYAQRFIAKIIPRSTPPRLQAMHEPMRGQENFANWNHEPWSAACFLARPAVRAADLGLRAQAAGERKLEEMSLEEWSAISYSALSLATKETSARRHKALA